MSTGRPLPRLLRTPMYCITVDGARFLELGVFASRGAAQTRADALEPRDWFSKHAVEISPIWVSAQDLHARARRRPAHPGRVEANAG